MLRILKPLAASTAIKSNGVIAVPGATSFAVEWLEYFAQRDVKVVFDNDYPRQIDTRTIQPGWDGEQRIIRLASENTHSARSISTMVWGNGDADAKTFQAHDPELADGYDVRDLLNAGEDFTHMDALAYLDAHLVTRDLSTPEKKPEPVEPLECTRFKALCKHFDAALHFPDPIRQTLAVMITTVISTNIDTTARRLLSSNAMSSFS